MTLQWWFGPPRQHGPRPIEHGREEEGLLEQKEIKT